MPASYVYKAEGERGKKGIFLVPLEDQRTTPYAILPDGTRIPGQYVNTNEGRHQYLFGTSILGQTGVKIEYNGKMIDLEDSNKSYEGNNPYDGWNYRAKGDLGSGGGGMGMGAGGMAGIGAGMGMMGNPYMIQFPSINYNPIDYKPIDYKPMETAPYKFTDPIEAAKRYNQFNLSAEQKSFDTGVKRGQQLTDLDTSNIENFAGRMSGLQQDLVASENKFNQAQRLQAVDFAMPDLRSSLDKKKGRAETYASGRLLSSAEDRAYEVAARSASADGSFVRGFGDDSVFGKRTSDVLAAQQRLGISQMGEGLLNDWISQGSSILIDTPLKSSISQRLPSTPPILPSQQASQQQSQLTSLSTVPLQFGISSEINQNQFSTNLEQGTRQFNKGNEFSKDQFNAGNVFAKDQFNASNTLSKDQFNASGEFAESQAQFSGLTTNYQLATQAANRVEDQQRADARNEAASNAANSNIAANQGAGTIGAAGQIIGAGITALPGIITAFNGGSQPVNTDTTGGTSGSAILGDDGGGGVSFSPGDSAPPFSMDNSGLAPDLSGQGGGGGGQVLSASGSAPDPGPMGGIYGGPDGSAPLGPWSGGGGVTRSAQLTTGSGAPLTYNDAPIPVSSGPYDATANAQQISEGMQQTGGFLNSLGRSGPATPQLQALGNGLRAGGTAAAGITRDFSSASTPEAQLMLANQLHGAAAGNAGDPESALSVDEIFAQVREHLDTGVGVNGQAAGIAGFIKNYDSYNGPERARAITNISFAGQDLEGKYGVKNLNAKTIGGIPIPGTNNKMNIQDAMSLSNSGYNVSSLVDNWDDIETVNGTLGNKGNVLNIASTARNLGLIDNETPDTVNARQTALRIAGAKPSGAWGAGAVSIPNANTALLDSLGMAMFGKTSEGQPIIAPKAAAASFGLSTGVVGSGMDEKGLKDMAPKTLAIGAKAAAVYKNWDTDFIPKDMGAMGSSKAVQTGLYKLGAKDPYLFGKVILGSLERGQVSQETQTKSAYGTQSNISTLTQANPQITQALRNDPRARVSNAGGSSANQNVNSVISLTQSIVNSAGKLGNADAAGAAPYVNAVASGKRLYDVLNNPNATDEQKVVATVQATQSGLQIAAALGSKTAASAVPYVNYAMAAYSASKILSSDLTDAQKATEMRQMAENTAAAIYTFGLSSIAQSIDAQFFGGKVEKFRDKMDKINPGTVLADKAFEFGLKAFDKVGDMFGGGKSSSQKARDDLRASAQQLGLVDKDFNITLASGKAFNIGVDGHGGDRPWHDPSQRRPDQTGVEQLRAWDLDYTKDLDAVMDVGGNALSMLMNGGDKSGDDPYVRQMGNQFTNAAVSDAGSADITKESFGTAQANMQGFFKKAGIETKDEAYALSNQLLEEGRISQMQVVTIQQGINLAFDANGFQTANQLLEGVKLGRKGDDSAPAKEGGEPASPAIPEGMTTLPGTIDAEDVDEVVAGVSGIKPQSFSGPGVLKSKEFKGSKAFKSQVASTKQEEMEIQNG